MSDVRDVSNQIRSRLAARKIRLDEPDVEALARVLPQIAEWEDLLGRAITESDAPWGIAK